MAELDQVQSSIESKRRTLSIIIPTYNESENILKLIKSIIANVPTDIFTEIIVVDDNSPDGTGEIVEKCVQSCTDLDAGPSLLEDQKKEGQKHNRKNRSDVQNYSIRVAHRKNKEGLISAILEGIK